MNDTTSLKHCCYRHCPTIFRSGSPLSRSSWPLAHVTLFLARPRANLYGALPTPSSSRARAVPERPTATPDAWVGWQPPSHARLHTYGEAPPPRPDQIGLASGTRLGRRLFFSRFPCQPVAALLYRSDPRRRRCPSVLLQPTVLSVYAISASGHHERFAPPVDLAPGPRGPGCRPIIGRAVRSPGSAASLCRMLPLSLSLPA